MFSPRGRGAISLGASGNFALFGVNAEGSGGEDYRGTSSHAFMYEKLHRSPLAPATTAAGGGGAVVEKREKLIDSRSDGGEKVSMLSRRISDRG